MATKAIPSKSLQQKMAKSVSSSTPNLVPPGIGSVPPAPPKQEDITPTIDQLFIDKKDRDNLRKLVTARIQLSSQIKQLESALEPINTSIKTVLGEHGIGNMDCDGSKIAYFPTERKTINAMKLLGAGVEQETIDLCTDVSRSSTLKITPPKI